MRYELIEGLTTEQVKKVMDCKDPKEILDLAKAEGIELNDEQLAAVSGGCGEDKAEILCPECGSSYVSRYKAPKTGGYRYFCHDCGKYYYWDYETNTRPM